MSDHRVKRMYLQDSFSSRAPEAVPTEPVGVSMYLQGSHITRGLSQDYILDASKAGATPSPGPSTQD